MTDCTACCKALECRADAIEANITKLFGRTNDIHGYLETFGDPNTHVYTVVSDEDELREAIALGGSVYLDAPVTTLNSAIIIEAPVKVIALNNDAIIKRTHTSVDQTIFDVRAANVELIGLRILADHPLFEETNIHDYAVVLSSAADVDVSGFKMMFCKLSKLSYGVYRDWGAAEITASRAQNIVIAHNEFIGFTHYGIWLRQNFEAPQIYRNLMIGTDPEVVHTNVGNAIWIGNHADRAFIDHNAITQWGRHGIEYWNTQEYDEDGNLYADEGNSLASITNNLIFDNYNGWGNGTFAISVFGDTGADTSGNIIICGKIGIEIYNTRASTAHHNVANNIIRDVAGQALSVNFVRSALITGNLFKDINSDHGLQIINGGRNIKIDNNVFVDAGKYHILVNSMVVLIDDIEIADDGWITATAALDLQRWQIGKEVRFFDLGGSTELNDEYFTVTEAISDKFKIGYDLSGVTPFTSGGSVRESYRFITITNNVFKFEDPTYVSGARSIYLQDVKDSFVNNNVAYVLDSLNVAVGSFTIINDATVHNGTAEVSTPLPSGAETAIGGGNIRMTYKAPLS